MHEQGQIMEELEDDWQEIDSGTLTSPEQLSAQLEKVKVSLQYPISLLTLLTPSPTPNPPCYTLFHFGDFSKN